MLFFFNFFMGFLRGFWRELLPLTLLGYETWISKPLLVATYNV